MKPGRAFVTMNLVLASMSILVAVGCDRLELDDEDARIHYSVGYQVGSDFRRQNVEIDPELVVRGLADAMTGSEPAMTPLEMRRELATLQSRVQRAQQSQSEESGESSEGQPE